MASQTTPNGSLPRPSVDSESGQGASHRRRWSPATVFTILTACLIVTGPIVGVGMPLEISQWYVAAAVDSELEGDLDSAHANLTRAIAWSCTNPAVFLARAELSMRQKDYETALLDYDRCLRFSPNALYAQTRRTEALQHLGRHEEAVAEWERLDALTQSIPGAARATFLNALAYARAVSAASLPPEERSKADLEKALDEIERAILLDRGSESARKNSAMLDTRGFIRLLRSEVPQATDDLNEAVVLATQELDALKTVKDYVDRQSRDDDIHLYQHGLAVMLYHRSMLWDELGETEKAAADRQQVDELGFSPDPSLF